MKHQRVTEILYPFTGMKYIDPVILENAAARGTKVHKICESIIEGIDGWGVPDELEGYVSSFRQWWKKGHEVVAVEKRMFCDKLGITGQADIIIKDEKKGLTIVDLKTSQSESKSWMLQGSAYSYLAKQMGYDVKNILFIRLRRDGSAPKFHEYEENFQLFEECLNVYRYFYGRKPRKRT